MCLAAMAVDPFLREDLRALALAEDPWRQICGVFEWSPFLVLLYCSGLVIQRCCSSCRLLVRALISRLPHDVLRT